MSESSKVAITAMVLTHNEAINVESCLRGLEAADEVIIVDSGSDDNTLDIAKSVRHDARIFHHPFEDFGAQRNWALENTEPKHQWILFVDADEFCPPELLAEINAFIEEPADDIGAYVAGRNYFLGRWLKHSTMYPSYQLRLLKLGHVSFRREGHGQRAVINGSTRYLKEGWRHDGFSKGVEQWIERHNRYSSDELELLLRLRNKRIGWLEFFASDPLKRRAASKRLASRLPFRPQIRFLYAYFLRGGWLDGYPGYIYCSLLMTHQIHIQAKLLEKLALTKSSDSES